MVSYRSIRSRVPTNFLLAVNGELWWRCFIIPFKTENFICTGGECYSRKLHLWKIGHQCGMPFTRGIFFSSKFDCKYHFDCGKLVNMKRIIYSYWTKQIGLDYFASCIIFKRQIILCTETSKLYLGIYTPLFITNDIWAFILYSHDTELVKHKALLSYDGHVSYNMQHEVISCFRVFRTGYVNCYAIEGTLLQLYGFLSWKQFDVLICQEKKTCFPNTPL